MLIDTEWYEKKKQQIFNDEYIIKRIKLKKFPNKIETRIHKLLMYYISYNYQKNNNLKMCENIDYVIYFENENEELKQTQDEYFQNFSFLKYLKDDEEIIITITLSKKDEFIEEI